MASAAILSSSVGWCGRVARRGLWPASAPFARAQRDRGRAVPSSPTANRRAPTETTRPAGRRHPNTIELPLCSVLSVSPVWCWSSGGVGRNGFVLVGALAESAGTSSERGTSRLWDATTRASGAAPTRRDAPHTCVRGGTPLSLGLSRLSVAALALLCAQRCPIRNVLSRFSLASWDDQLCQVQRSSLISHAPTLSSLASLSSWTCLSPLAAASVQTRTFWTNLTRSWKTS